MKKTIKLFGIIALAMIIGFSMASCGDDGGDDSNTATYTGTKGGTTYKLKITQARAITPLAGDAYELTVDKKKSTGTVDAVTGDTLTLQPKTAGADTFTAEIGDNGLANVSGLITFDNDPTPVPGPGDLTPSGGGGGGSGGDGGGNTGKLTVTDIPAKFNGKYAGYFVGTNDDDLHLQGSAGENSIFGTVKISNGRVIIPIWRLADGKSFSYSGNDTVDNKCSFMIYSGDTINSDTLATISWRNGITFKNGSATVSANDATINEVK